MLHDFLQISYLNGEIARNAWKVVVVNREGKTEADGSQLLFDDYTEI